MDFMAIWDLIVTGILRGGIYVLMSMGLSLVFGVMNIPNFAHGDFYMIGAYMAFFSSTILGLNPIYCILLAAIVGFASGAIMEKTTFMPLRKRSQGDWVMNSFMVTAGLGFVLQNLAQALIGVDVKGISSYWKGSIGGIGSMSISIDRALAFVIAMMVVGLFWMFLTKTKTGNSIRAVAENETGAMIVGVDLNRVHTLTFALSCMLAAIAGAVLLSITPAYPMMGMQPLYKSWFVVILVGMGNVGATVIGGLIVGLIEAISYYSLGAGWQDVVSLSVIMAVLLFKPSGIFGKEVKGIWEK